MSSVRNIKPFQSIGCLVLISVSALAQAPKSGPYQKEAAVTEAKGVVHIAANSPRPLEQVLDAVQLKYGWIIGYEDPQYTAHDVVDAPGDATLRLPGGGSFSVDFPSAAPDEEKMLHVIVDAYNHSKNPGQFEVRRGPENTYFVVGIGSRDEKGAVSPQSAPLDVLVTLPNEERGLNDTLSALCQEVTKQSHLDVQVAVSPRSLMAKTTSKIGGNKVQARDILIQINAATQHKLYWRLLNDPNSKGFLLDIHSIRAQPPK